MPKETRLFVEPDYNISMRCQISQNVSKELGVSSGGQVILINPDNGKRISCNVDISADVLDFAVKVASDVLTQLNFDGVEIIVSSETGKSSTGPQPGIPRPTIPQPGMPKPTIPQSGMPEPSIPQSDKTSQGIPRPPGMSPPPSMKPPSIQPPTVQPQNSSEFGTQQVQPSLEPSAPIVEPYPNKVDVNKLASQKKGSIILTVVKEAGCGGRAKLSEEIIKKLGLTQGMLIGWECPLTRSEGSARITSANILLNEIHMDSDTIEDTNIKSEQIVVYSTEPPIKHQDTITLEVVSQPGLEGYIKVNPRNAATLQVKEGEVLAFEDSLTGAMGAAKFMIQEDLSNDKVVIDSELLEASGVGSPEVDLKKNIRKIIPLQSMELGIAPIRGENVWEIISAARQNINSIKAWLGGYIIFKGIKLRWEAANVGCEVLSTVPNLEGDVFAEITQSTTITLKPVGLVTFNAVLIIDISRSMMGRDVEVKNIGPALEGIKAAMHAKEIQEFLTKFKPGILVPRRYSAAFAAILFLSEKVGRGFGEKVAIIRFADEAQVLSFSGGKQFMESSSGEKGILEDAARMIVEQIGNAYGQATNMGLAMLKAQEMLNSFHDDLPTMIVLLTDGVPTDGNQFFEAVQEFSKNPNVVMYIIGLGNPDDDAMKHAASLCGGEYFKPQDSGELLIWYSKRARDLQVKLKGTH